MYIVGRSMGPDAAGYTSSYTPNDPTHPLDPRKIFSRSFCSPILRSKRSATASTSEDLIWSTTFSFLHPLLTPVAPAHAPPPPRRRQVSCSVFHPAAILLPLSLDPYPMVYHIPLAVKRKRKRRTEKNVLCHAGSLYRAVVARGPT